MITAAALMVLASAPNDAEACSCLPTDLAASYNSNSDVIRAQVLFGVQIGWHQWYIARSLGTFKGCIEKNAWVYIRTASDGAACGVTLQKGTQYLLTANMLDAGWSIPVLSIDSCDYNVPISSLSKKQRKFLMTRYNCCGDSCACVDGSEPVNCFADPCSVADCPSGTCEANYCGGCHAEFYDDYGMAVCTPCLSNSDCPWTQTCDDGMCVAQCYEDKDCSDGFWCSPTQTEGVKTCKAYAQKGESCGGYTPAWAQSKCDPELTCVYPVPTPPDAPGTCQETCQTNDDCPESMWCSPTQDNPSAPSQCKPYAQEGDFCGGFTPAWAQSICAPGLTCTDYPPFIADAPGTCRRPCESNSDCKDAQYCATSGVCRDDGACNVLADCNVEGNLYAVPLCIGYATCEEGQCGWECGDPTCQDVSNVFFGFCDAIVGVGLVNGKCEWISGCDDQGYKLFDSMEACKESCSTTTTDACNLSGAEFGACAAVLGWGAIGGQCTWISGCGDPDGVLFDSKEACEAGCGAGPSCKDLSDVDFGECEMALGVGVVDGQCAYVSGCDDYGYSFFSSMDACKASCMNSRK